MAMLVLLGLCFQNNLRADQGREIRPPGWKQDATINDTFWIDNETGWVVGDQGLILRTTDGGQTWLESEGTGQDLDNHRSLEQKLLRMRPISRTHELIPLSCSFNSVHFINRKRGWVAGNFHTPYLNTTRSVLLTTDDGGRTWSQLKGSILPGIHRIYFQDVLGGWALGRAGNVFKSGVFATSTGGRIWTVQDSGVAGNWIDGDLTARGFVVINDEGNLGRIIAGKFEPSVVLGDRPGQMRSVRMVNSDIGWAVGSAGTVLQTRDAGLTWQRPKLDVDSSLRQFDFNAVHISGEQVFIAGNPGTFVFRLNAIHGDGLLANPTHFSFPIKKIFFSSADSGCVVGAGGLIAVSNDAGENWDVQRSIHDRIAVLSVGNQPNELPLACLASFAGEQNRLVSHVVLGQHAHQQMQISAGAQRRIGIGTQIEIRGDNTSIEQPAVDPETLLLELVRTIRTLRPNVVVCGQADPELELVCRTAIEHAAVDDKYPDQISNAGLNVWQVDRLMARRNAWSGGIKFDSNTYLPRTGRLLEDQIAIALGSLNRSAIYDEAEFYAIESYNGSVSVRGNNVFFGLEHLGREIPSRTQATKLGNLNSIATAPLKHSQMQQLIDLAVGDSESQAKAQIQIKNFGATQSSRESGIWLMQLAEKFLAVGQQEMAASTLEQLVNRHANHAFAPAALMWLTQHYASDEVTAAIFAEHQQEREPEIGSPIPTEHESDSHSVNQEIEVELDETELLTANSIPVTSVDNGVRQVSWQPEPDAATAALDDRSLKTVRDWRTRNASHYLERLKQSNLDFAQSPDVQFLEATLSRKIPGDLANQNLLKKIKRTAHFQAPIRRAASRELKAEDESFQQVISSIRIENRPELDGELNDDVWQQAMANGTASFKLVTPADKTRPAFTDVCWLANDDEFLFVAARCIRLDRNSYQRSNAKPHRSRDPDLNGVDRIVLELDLDRDMRSGFRFEIDSRGRAAESCCGSVGWDPQWFVAVAEHEDAWSLECAIPLDELMVHSIDENRVVAVSLARLDSRSVDVWSTASDRRIVSHSPGILASLKIEPERYELLRLAVTNPADEVER